jgi:hypothetical protein
MRLCPARATPPDPLPDRTGVTPALPKEDGRDGGCATRPKAVPWHTDTRPKRSIVFCVDLPRPSDQPGAAGRVEPRGQWEPGKVLSRRVARIFVKPRRGCGITASRRHPGYLQNPDAAVKRDGDHVSTLDIATGRRHPQAVDPHMPCRNQRRGGAARPHDAGIPQPSVDPLPVARQETSRLSGALWRRLQAGP